MTVSPRRAANLVAAGFSAGFTDRHGGVSAAPYGTLNLAFHVGDDPARVAENRRRAAVAFGVRYESLAGAEQAHGDGIGVVGLPPAPGTAVGKYDALVTATPGTTLVVFIADCLPVLLADPKRRVIAAVHGGRRSTLLGIVPKTVACLRDRFGTDPRDLVSALGPVARGCCYEVGEPERAELAAFRPDDWRQYAAPSGNAGHWLLDLTGLTQTLLAEAGVPAAAVAVYGGCTITDPNCFSHRREGVTGRMGAFIALPDGVGG